MPSARNTLLILTSSASLAAGGSVFGKEPPPALVAFLDNHCLECHDDETQKGKLNLLDLPFSLSDPGNFETWRKVFDRVKLGEMPPEKKPRPAAPAQKLFLKALKSPLVAADEAERAKHGRVNARRLTRVEYEHTVHDLLGIGIPLKNQLPEDPVTDGFETVAEGQQLSHHHMARYLEVADAALDEAFKRALGEDSKYEKHFTPKDLTNNRGGGNYRGPDLRDDRSISWPLTLQFFGRLPITRAPESGWYRVTLHDVQAVNPGKDGAVWGSLRSGACASNAPILYWISVIEATAKPRDLSYTAWIEKGHMLELKPNDAQLKRPPTGASGGNVSFKGRDLASQGFSGIANRGITMKRVYPFGDRSVIRKNLFGDVEPWGKGSEAKEKASRLLTRFARRAFRRPVTADQLAPYRALVDEALAAGQPLPAALKVGYRAVLCSPRFLTLREPPGKLDNYAIASRLSYTLWDSMPDWPLAKAAAEEDLRDANVLGREIERMLASAKSRRFIESFTDQWLDLRDIDFTSPDRRLFRGTFDQPLKHLMLAETRKFVRDALVRDRPVTEFVHSEHAFLNGRLARHYGIKAETKPGAGLQPVKLGDKRRGGLVTQAAVLKITANGTNTSPVMRGVWVNERILGRHIPPPPPDVPAVEPDIRGAKSIRDQLAKHRSSELCASCHRTIDPAGFALESFDPIGRWRERYGPNGKGGAKVDPTGVTPRGDSFDDIRGWKDIYLQKPEMLARAFAEQLLTYATGAPIRFSERDEVEAIVRASEKGDYGVRSILRAALTSPVFLDN